MKKLLSAYKNKARRYKYLLSKLMKDPGKHIVIYNRPHPIYTSIFEGVTFNNYKFVLLDFTRPLNMLEKIIFRKARIVHADASSYKLSDYKGKIVVVESEFTPTEEMLNDDRVKKIYLFSKAAAPLLAGVHPKVEVLYPSIKVPPHAQSKTPNPNEIVLTSVGYGSIRKGFDVLFKIYESLKDKYPVKLIIAGTMGHNWEHFPEITKATYDRANFPEIERKIKADPNVRMEPIKNAALMTEVFPNTDIYVHLCRLESFGYSVLEAMSFGMPVVSTKQWAMPEIVADGVTGFLVNDFKDDINSEAWFDKSYKEGLEVITRLIEDVQLRKQMGAASYKRVQEVFDIDKKRAKLEADYDMLMKKG